MNVFEVDQIFRDEIATCASRGWQIRHNDTIARRAVFYSPGGRCNHLIHAIMSVFTLLLWTPIWFLAALTTQGPRTFSLAVDETGLVRYTKPISPGKA